MFLSLCLALFLVSGMVSAVDDSLVLLLRFHLLTAISGILFCLSFLIAMLVYVMMGITPLVPKRLFLPVTLFYAAALLLTLPILIYWYHGVLVVDWIMSCCQVFVGLAILHAAQGGPRPRWPLVPVDRLGVRGLQLVEPVRIRAVQRLRIAAGGHCLCFSLRRPGREPFHRRFHGPAPKRVLGAGAKIRPRRRQDDRVVPDGARRRRAFLPRVSRTFPTNSIILMEGVTDDKNLLTNKISYRRMAKSLGLAEQHEAFTPSRGERVDADVDVDQFTPDTIDFLNLVMLVHAKGFTPGNLQKLMQYSPPPHLEEEVINDLLRKRNEHVVEEIQSELPQTDYIMVPWGVAHMPGIAKQIQKAGFRLDQTQEYMVIQFGRSGNPDNGATPKENSGATR